MIAIDALMNLSPADVSRMSQSELASAVRHLGASVRTSMSHLKSSAPTSPALLRYERAGQPSFSIYKAALSPSGKRIKVLKSQGELQHEFAFARSFRQMKSSTIGGYRDTLKATFGDFEAKAPEFTNATGASDLLREFWTIFNACQDDASAASISPSDLKAMVMEIQQDYPQASTEKKIEILKRRINAVYEDYMQGVESGKKEYKDWWSDADTTDEDF